MTTKNETTETKTAETTPAATETAKVAALAQNVESFLKAQLAVAQKRIEELETEAQKVVKTLESRGQEAAKEAQALWGKLQAGELLADPRVQELGKKVESARAELGKRLDGIQTKVVEAVGVASQAQLKDLNKELAKLSRKVDALLKPVRRGSNGAAKSASSPASAPRA
ncbi:hypothetical protein HPC49_41620 [Pyxidicoccus fallax]|uniref:Phasin family protein n=1 Tax=Pyxidicoccus fallax TaxID=394095 RepID=A0A848LH01_9BACT|nr:hypothetical protein [Pyxidicoccus fallax]NMO16835.1 hypothetical protein [Pyxidicoccus fallax]NPC84703.1 hypothetical protein [Pyxidicoccus fallax]